MCITVLEVLITVNLHLYVATVAQNKYIIYAIISYK